MKNILILSIALFSCSTLCAQKKIKLTHSGKTRIIKVGMRVGYTTLENAMIKKGTLKTITNSSIVVDNTTIAIDDLQAIGRKRGGSGFFQFLCGFLAGALIKDAVSPTDNTPSCSGCQTTTSVDQGAVAGEILLGSAFIGLGVNSILSNSPRKLSKWKLEIID